MKVISRVELGTLAPPQNGILDPPLIEPPQDTWAPGAGCRKQIARLRLPRYDRPLLNILCFKHQRKSLDLTHAHNTCRPGMPTCTACSGSRQASWRPVHIRRGTLPRPGLEAPAHQGGQGQPPVGVQRIKALMTARHTFEGVCRVNFKAPKQTTPELSQPDSATYLLQVLGWEVVAMVQPEGEGACIFLVTIPTLLF